MGRQDGAAQRPGQVHGQSRGHTARPEARPRPHSAAPERRGPGHTAWPERRSPGQQEGDRQHASCPETQTQAEGNPGQIRGFILRTNQPLGHAASRELAGPVLICQVCELRLSEELLLSFQKTHSCTPQSAASCLFVLVPRGAQCGRKDVGALWTHRGVLVTSEPASVCWAGHPARVCRGWWWWQGALLGGGPRLLASDSAPSGRVAVDVPPSRAWPPAICKAPEWSVFENAAATREKPRGSHRLAR